MKLERVQWRANVKATKERLKDLLRVVPKKLESDRTSAYNCLNNYKSDRAKLFLLRPAGLTEQLPQSTVRVIQTGHQKVNSTRG